jgi:hypothetical protein
MSDIIEQIADLAYEASVQTTDDAGIARSKIYIEKILALTKDYCADKACDAVEAIPECKSMANHHRYGFRSGKNMAIKAIRKALEVSDD